MEKFRKEMEVNKAHSLLTHTHLIWKCFIIKLSLWRQSNWQSPSYPLPPQMVIKQPPILTLSNSKLTMGLKALHPPSKHFLFTTEMCQLPPWSFTHHFPLIMYLAYSHMTFLILLITTKGIYLHSTCSSTHHALPCRVHQCLVLVLVRRRLYMYLSPDPHTLGLFALYLSV